MEDRRRIWTNFSYLNLWFDEWEDSLICIALASEVNGKVELPDEPKKRIINLYESCLSLDGSDGTKGGRPVVSFYDPTLPNLGRVASKSSTTATVICGSSAFDLSLERHY